jgi:hypothetical protein
MPTSGQMVVTGWETGPGRGTPRAGKRGCVSSAGSEEERHFLYRIALIEAQTKVPLCTEGGQRSRGGCGCSQGSAAQSDVCVVSSAALESDPLGFVAGTAWASPTPFRRFDGVSRIDTLRVLDRQPVADRSGVILDVERVLLQPDFLSERPYDVGLLVCRGRRTPGSS